MLYKDAFQSATALKLGGIVTIVSFSLFSIASASAIPVSSLVPRQLKPTVVSDYSPPHNQRQPPRHELTKPTSGRSNEHREPPSDTDKPPGSEGEGNANPNQDPNELEVPEPRPVAPAN